MILFVGSAESGSSVVAPEMSLKSYMTFNNFFISCPGNFFHNSKQACLPVKRR